MTSANETKCSLKFSSKIGLFLRLLYAQLFHLNGKTTHRSLKQELILEETAISKIRFQTAQRLLPLNSSYIGKM